MFACLHAPDLEESNAATLVNCACGFSPRVEETDARTVIMDVTGLDRLLGPPERMAQAMARRAAELGMRVNIAVASNPDAAALAARGFSGITLLAAGEEAQKLGALPIGILAAPPDIEETLYCWGIRTLRELAALPEAGLAERLGPEGVRLHKLARGAADRALAPAILEIGFAESLELEHPVAMIEPLLFLLARLLGDLLPQLRVKGLATNELRLRLKLEDQSEHARVLRLPFPMRSQKTFLKLVQLDLESHPPRAPVAAMSIEAVAVDPRIVQHGLFLPATPEPEKLELTLGRIAKLVGAEKVGTAQLLDSHRPGGFRMKRFGEVGIRRKFAANSGDGPWLALRVFRPPRHAKVELIEGRPRRIAARGLRGTVASLAGPWRSSGEWWDAGAWTHDEWDVALDDGSLYRIYRDRLSGEWFVEGSYD